MISMKNTFLHPFNPRSPQMVVYVLAALTIVAVAWAYFTPIDISVRARGIVRPEGDPIRIISEAGGRITKVCVAEGSIVEAGDTLIQLDTHDLLMKKRGLETRIHFTEVRLADLQRQLSDASSIEQESASVDSLEHDAAQRTVHTNVEIARLRFARTDLLFHQGLVARQAHDESRTALAQAEAEELRLSSKSLDLKRSQSMAHLRELEASATPIRSELATVYHDLDQTGIDLGRLTITSPAGGQITSLVPLHYGEILAAGAAIAALVPSAKSEVIETALPTADRIHVHTGQLVRLQSDSALPNHDDAFDGRVLSISADARFNESLMGAYRVVITPGADAPDLHLGMTFQVHFVTREERLLWVLFDKLRGGFEE